MPAVAAQPAFPDMVNRTIGQFEISAPALPRFDSSDASMHSSRIDMIWLPPHRFALGPSLGVDKLQLHLGDGPSVDVGLHWRYTLDSNYRVDFKAWRRLMTPNAFDLAQSRQEIYGARVEMQIAAPHRGLVADQGFLGLQLESGARLTLRRHSGGPMIYYRDNF